MEGAGGVGIDKDWCGGGDVQWYADARRGYGSGKVWMRLVKRGG